MRFIWALSRMLTLSPTMHLRFYRTLLENTTKEFRSVDNKFFLARSINQTFTQTFKRNWRTITNLSARKESRVWGLLCLSDRVYKVLLK